MNIDKKLIIAKLILKKVIAFYDEHGRLPSYKSKDENERKLDKWIGANRRAKGEMEKEHGKGTWHPELETIAIKHGMHDLFIHQGPKQIAINNLMLVIAFYNEYRRIPVQKTKNKTEAKIGRWLITQRQAKKRKTSSIFYPELEIIAKKHGLPTLFEIKRKAIKKVSA